MSSGKEEGDLRGSEVSLVEEERSEVSAAKSSVYFDSNHLRFSDRSLLICCCDRAAYANQVREESRSEWINGFVVFYLRHL